VVYIRFKCVPLKEKRARKGERQHEIARKSEKEHERARKSEKVIKCRKRDK